MMEMFCLDCMDVSFPAVMLNYSFARLYHREELSKGYMGSVRITILALNVNLRLHQNKKVNFKKSLKGIVLLYLRCVKGRKSLSFYPSQSHSGVYI